MLSHDSQKIRIRIWGASADVPQGVGVHPKNVYQGMALDALLDPHIDLVILTGPAGCGKTLLAMAAALELVIEKGIYEGDRHPQHPEIAESIGFLPGTEEEKMMPWLAAVTDTLEVLHKQDENMSGSLSYIMEGQHQFKSVNFMRGRSIQNTFVLLDECQNLTASQIKTIITRWRRHQDRLLRQPGPDRLQLPEPGDLGSDLHRRAFQGLRRQCQHLPERGGAQQARLLRRGKPLI